MRPLAEAFAQFTQTRAPNLIGHGGRPVPERFSIPEFAADVVECLDREGIDHVGPVQIKQSQARPAARHSVLERLGWPAEHRRGDGLVLRDLDAAGLGVVHALEVDQLPRGVGDGDRHLPAVLARFGLRRGRRLAGLLHVDVLPVLRNLGVRGGGGEQHGAAGEPGEVANVHECPLEGIGKAV